ncbi:MAG TPA: transglutaminase domain-containing protein [Iamia sp.]
MRDLAQGRITDPGRHAAAVAALPADLDALISVVQGLVVHVHLAGIYGVTVDDDDAVHERRVEAILDRVLALDPAPLDVARPPERRVLGNCRQISVLMTALLRAHGRPARARCGFGSYFVEGAHEDHWVCETEVGGRWVLVDAQMDAVQREMFAIDFPVTDVPRDRFVVAGDAWTAYRAGRVDPDRYGLSILDDGGPSWIAGNLVRDAASLAGTEMLPWDIWGAMSETDDHTDFLDRLAVLTADPDAHRDELARLAADDGRVRVPERVVNALRARDEPVW